MARLRWIWQGRNKHITTKQTDAVKNQQQVLPSKIHLQHYESLLSMLAVASCAFLLYGRALSFAFFNDDPSGNFAWMEHRTLLQLFTSSEGYGFYRPLGFAVWKGLLDLCGGYHSIAFHALSLAIHTANVALLWLLMRSLTQAAIIAWGTALLFATFPLHYEAVAYVAAFFHPLLMFWLLLALLLYYQARQRECRRCYWAAHGMLILGLLTHENGVIAPLLILILEFAQRPFSSLADLRKRPVWPFWAAPLMFLLFWWQMPKVSMGTLQQPHEIWVNLLPFLQTLAYPLMPVFRPDVFNVIGLRLLALLTLALTHVAARFISQERLWSLGLFWFLVTAMPSLLFLNNEYLRGSPRLYYLPAAGATILWGLSVAAVGKLTARWRGSLLMGRALQAIVLLAMVLPPLPFIICQTDFYARTSDLVRQIADLAQSAPSEKRLIFINLPFFFTSSPDHPRGCPATYPHVNTGAVVIPLYARLSDFIRINGGPLVDAEGAIVTAYDSDWPPRYGGQLSLADVRNHLVSSTVFVFDTRTWSFWNLSEIWRVDVKGTSAKVVTFAGEMALQAAEVQRQENRLIVTLEWRVLQPPVRPLTAFVHLYDEHGKLLVQHDGAVGQNGAPVNYAPPDQWRMGDVIRDVHVLTKTDAIFGPPFILAVGLYDSNTIERLPAMTSDGKRLANDLVVLPW